MDELKQKIIETLLAQLVNERPDSLEFGTPSKGGTVKVYFDSGNLDDTKKRIDNAIAAREYANQKLHAPPGGPS
jgi:hypothetical protein